MSFLGIFLGMMTVGVMLVLILISVWALVGGLSKLADWLSDKFGETGEMIFILVLGGFVIPFILSVAFWVIANLGGVS